MQAVCRKVSCQVLNGWKNLPKGWQSSSAPGWHTTPRDAGSSEVEDTYQAECWRLYFLLPCRLRQRRKDRTQAPAKAWALNLHSYLK
jgi:hypothetical protein